jgi:uncharacterized protein (TIGR02996 family)
MSEHPGLLQTIIENPDDDAPRLIYADWLDDQGEHTRAGFIRAQCLLARFCNNDQDRQLQDESLAGEYRQLLLAPFLALGFPDPSDSEYAGAFGFSYRFRRGFVEEMDVSGTKAAMLLLNKAPQLFALTPLQRLRFIYSPHAAPQARGRMGLAALTALAQLPEVSRLKSLELISQNLTHKAACVLLQSPYFKQIPQLYVDGYRFNDADEHRLQEHFGDRLILVDEEIPF